MNHPQQPSRRDWFRLRPRPSNPTTLGAGRPTDQANGFQTIDLPSDEGPLDPNDLPPMREAFLTNGQVANLFTDIESAATDVLLMQRRSARATVQTEHSLFVRMQHAKNALLTGQMPRVQIRYRWNDANWIDTLEATDNQFRLVRISHPGDAGSHSRSLIARFSHGCRARASTEGRD